MRATVSSSQLYEESIVFDVLICEKMFLFSIEIRSELLVEDVIC